MRAAAVAAALAIALLGGGAAFAQELPQRDPNKPLDFEPNLQLTDVEPDPNAPAGVEKWATPAEVEKMRATAERAKRKADRWQKLQKNGVVSKVEVEKAIGAANRAAVRYQQARIAHLTAEVESLRERAAKGQASADLVQSAENALQTTQQLAAEAEATARRTEVEFAQNDLERQRKLAAAGLGSKRSIERAANKVEQLKPKE